MKENGCSILHIMLGIHSENSIENSNMQLSRNGNFSKTGAHKIYLYAMQYIQTHI